MHAQVRHGDVGIGVEPGDVKGFIEYGPEPEVATKGEPVVITVDEQSVEQDKDQQGAHCQPALVFSYLKEFEHHSNFQFSVFQLFNHSTCN